MDSPQQREDQAGRQKTPFAEYLRGPDARTDEVAQRIHAETHQAMHQHVVPVKRIQVEAKQRGEAVFGFQLDETGQGNQPVETRAMAFDPRIQTFRKPGTHPGFGHAAGTDQCTIEQQRNAEKLERIAQAVAECEGRRKGRQPSQRQQNDTGKPVLAELSYVTDMHGRLPRFRPHTQDGLK